LHHTVHHIVRLRRRFWFLNTVGFVLWNSMLSKTGFS
jgi:hypothetical protein